MSFSTLLVFRVLYLSPASLPLLTSWEDQVDVVQNQRKPFCPVCFPSDCFSSGICPASQQLFDSSVASCLASVKVQSGCETGHKSLPSHHPCPHSACSGHCSAHIVSTQTVLYCLGGITAWLLSAGARQHVRKLMTEFRRGSHRENGGSRMKCQKYHALC